MHRCYAIRIPIAWSMALRAAIASVSCRCSCAWSACANECQRGGALGGECLGMLADCAAERVRLLGVQVQRRDRLAVDGQRQRTDDPVRRGVTTVAGPPILPRPRRDLAQPAHRPADDALTDRVRPLTPWNRSSGLMRYQTDGPLPEHGGHTSLGYSSRSLICSRLPAARSAAASERCCRDRRWCASWSPRPAASARSCARAAASCVRAADSCASRSDSWAFLARRADTARRSTARMASCPARWTRTSAADPSAVPARRSIIR